VIARGLETAGFLVEGEGAGLQDQIPFGSFLALGAALSCLWGERIIAAVPRVHGSEAVTPARRSPFGSYEQRVRFFLGLLVLVLAAANAANFLLLRAAWQSLHDATEETVDVRGSAAAREILARRSAAGGAGALGVGDLGRIAGRGRRPLGGDPRRGGKRARGVRRHGSGTAGSGLSARPAPRRARLGRSLVPPSTHLIDRSGVMVRFQAVVPERGKPGWVIKSIHDTTDLAEQRRAYLWLVGTQTIAILVVLIAAAAFGRWIARPYRLIAEEAGAAQLLQDGGDEPEDLVAAMRRVMGKVRDQDEELRALHAQAETPALDLRKFAEGAARGMTSGLIALDAEGNFIAANPAAARILGWSEPPSKAATLESWAGRGSALTKLIRGSLDGRVTRSREIVEHRSPAGGGRPLQLGVALSPILRESPGEREGAAEGGGAEPGAGAASGLLCLIGDLTEIHDLEEKVRRRETLAALGTVSAGIAHEVRNALATILGFARLAERGGGGPRSADHARAIVKEVEAVSRTVEDFLQYARPSRLNPVPVPLRALVDQVVDEARHAGLLGRTEVEVEGDAGTILADEQALRQTFSNLVRNASESADRPVHLRIGLDRREGRATITFADDGEGIPTENLDRIFLPFFTTRGKGTGLGLAIAQKMVLDHEGLLEVAAAPGGGTVFRVQLPGRS
jgi:signal transduction histidine kinase